MVMEQNIQSNFMTAAEVAATLQCSLARGYKTCRELNAELDAKGIRTMHGRTSRRYFLKRYGLMDEEQEVKL